MSYSEQIRHPDGALNPPKEKQGSGVSWWWWIVAAIAVVILVAVFRPQWLAKLGIHLGGSSGLGGGINPLGWK